VSSDQYAGRAARSAERLVDGDEMIARVRTRRSLRSAPSGRSKRSAVAAGTAGRLVFLSLWREKRPCGKRIGV
jgi:hypothetical protein